MSLDIDNKIYRNMQEQVAHNASNIQKIKEYLDGIQFEDKLVVIDAISGNISDEELAILMKPLAFISYNNGVYIKASESSTEIVFKLCGISASEVGSAYFNLGGEKVVVNKSTKAYVVQSDPIITTYSKSQIDSIIANINALKANVSDVYTKAQSESALALKANLAGADFTGAVTAPTLAQSVANYEIALHFYEPTDLTINQIYSKLKIVNGIIHIVVCFEVKNNSGAPKSFQSIYADFSNLPENVRKLIYDIDGKTLDENPTVQNTKIQIRTAMGVVNSRTSTSNSNLYLKVLRYNKQIGVDITTPSSITLNNEESRIIQGYTALIAI